MNFVHICYMMPEYHQIFIPSKNSYQQTLKVMFLFSYSQPFSYFMVIKASRSTWIRGRNAKDLISVI